MVDTLVLGTSAARRESSNLSGGILICPFSSVDRATGFYPVGREFESLKGCYEL